MTRASRDDRRQRSDRRAVGRVLLVAERLLLAGGLLCVGVWVTACAGRTLFQAEEHARFDEQIRIALAAENPDQREWSAERIAAYRQATAGQVDALARLTIPAADLSVMVLEGTEDAVLDRAVGRIPGTAMVGETGNVGIAGHRDGFFRGLRHLRLGDEVLLATIQGVSRYRVSGLRVVEPEAVDVLDPTATPTITLVTCYPFYYVGSAPQRYIVQAEWVGFDTWSPDSADAYVQAAHLE